MTTRRFPRFLNALALFGVVTVAQAAEDHYTAEKIYNLRPKEEAPRDLGHIGPTGILAHIEPGVKVTVQGTRDGSPAAGKFAAGEVITAVNGQRLHGLNPYVVLGEAITMAEAADGKLTFEVETGSNRRNVTIHIPVLGAYGENWPVDCAKSQIIIEQAAAFYAASLKEAEGMGVGEALTCLFLLSTGDDQYLPLVKEHYKPFIDNPDGIGSHTWNNGYNGIACAEYYLRTGDADMLPVLQAFCDDARDRQNFNSAWKHWGSDINPGYVAGGLMNPASTQVLTTLLLCKEAGVNVDEKTLTNALRYFYRFVGHGTVAYGDHRGEGGLGSNGKDAMLAVGMQVAAGASGDSSIYQSARDCLAMATLNSTITMITGHADNGRGDGIWRGLVSTYLMDKAPEQFREKMDGIRWWFDLSRYDDGGIGLATCKAWNDPGSGAGAAMTYTAPLKTLRITGAPLSKHGKAFTLPERIWGNEADLAFHRITPVDGYEEFGKPMPMHRILPLIGTGYAKAQVESDPDSVSLDQLQRLIRHQDYMIRAQAAKGILAKGGIELIEKLLNDPDPRLRRAALDAILDWRYWFSVGRNPLAADRFTPGMTQTITAMLSNPDEAIYVVEGALFAIGRMPADVIQGNIDAILPWTKHDDWWFRHASFMALHGLEKEPELFLKVVPVLIEQMIRENHTMPRAGMNRALAESLKKFGADSEIGMLLAKGFDQGVAETQILAGRRDREGVYNLNHAISQAAKVAPELAPQLASTLVNRGLTVLDDDELLGLVVGGRGADGLLKVLPKLKGDSRKRLEATLYEDFRPEVAKRLKASGGTDIKTIDALLALMELGEGGAGWDVIGSPQSAERTWHYFSFHPTAEQDLMPKREGRRFRQVGIAPELKDWFKPEFDASGWQSGPAPIGKGGHPRAGGTVEHRSPWGEGEFLLARTTFEIDDLDYDLYRLRILCIQGYEVYLNGKKIRTYRWWQAPREYRSWSLNSRQAALLKKGTNTLAIYTMEVYPSAQRPHWKDEVFGQVDAYIEGLRKEDLY